MGGPYAGPELPGLDGLPKHAEHPAFRRRRHQVLFCHLCAKERGHHWMEFAGHRQCFLPRSIQKSRIQHYHGCSRGQHEKVSYFQSVGAMDSNSCLSEYRSEKADVMVEAAEKNTFYNSTS